jgi:hypothetical protein
VEEAGGAAAAWRNPATCDALKWTRVDNTTPWRDEGGVEALGQGKIAREMEDSEGVVVVSTDVI